MRENPNKLFIPPSSGLEIISENCLSERKANSKGLSIEFLKTL
ncbi:hypothetical protein [Mycoplasma wenyonii]|nr:hypothetical protein [Mycoplasma wenyonii]